MNNQYIRVVRMTFKKDKAEEFQDFFETVKEKIKEFKGCRYIAMLKDEKLENVFAFYSAWDNKDNLEDYRKSSFYRKIWSQTKSYFAAPPSAWSFTVCSEA